MARKGRTVESASGPPRGRNCPEALSPWPSPGPDGGSNLDKGAGAG